MKTEAQENETAQFAQTMREIADGKREGFAGLHQQWSGLVYGVAYRVLNDPQDAEDVTQEVFTNLWKKAGMYDSSRGKPQTWIASLARNRAIDRLRSKQRRAQLRDELEEEKDVVLRKDYVDVFGEVRKKEASRLLKAAVCRLSPEQKEAIEMTYFGGLSQSQAADALGAPLGTIKARIRRGIMRLREIVPQSV